MRRSLCFALLLAVALGGCAGGDMADLKEYIARVESREPGTIDPLPEIKQIETFAYNADSRRDPFAVGETAEAETIPTPTSSIAPPVHKKQELENFSLDSLRMVGTLEQNYERWALIRGTDGTLYRVRAGNYMGRNHGQITRVTPDRIELTEIVADSMGGYQERQAAVSLSVE